MPAHRDSRAGHSATRCYARTLVMALLAVWLAGVSGAADLRVTVTPPASAEGAVVFWLFDSPHAFASLREPARAFVFPVFEPAGFSLTNVPAGEYALTVFLDVNRNGRLDRNFIGIPAEPVGFPNAYRPKGPPVYDRARFQVPADATLDLDVSLARPLGRRGRIGIGPGAMWRRSPYRGAEPADIRFIPAVAYIGERIQIFGPSMRVGIAGSGPFRFAGTLGFRPGAYEESDSPVLEGMGDRRDTMLAGLALGWDAPAGLDLRADYRHDALDRIGGGTASLSVRKSWQWRRASLAPGLGINWTGSELADDDFGVPADRATANRPAYRPGAYVSADLGAALSVELTERMRAAFDARVEFPESAVGRSPLVADRPLVSGFAFISVML